MTTNRRDVLDSYIHYQAAGTGSPVVFPHRKIYLLGVWRPVQQIGPIAASGVPAEVTR